MLERGLRLYGHPVHTMAVHFPIGLLLGSVAWDGMALWSSESIWWTLSRYTIALGLISAVPAILTGFVDYVSVMGRRAEEIGKTANAHMLLALGGVGIFLASWLVRRAYPPHGESAWLSVGLSGIGALCLMVAGRLGGTLVLNEGVGSEDDDA